MLIGARRTLLAVKKGVVEVISTVFSLSLTGNDNGSAGYTLRNRCLTTGGGTKVRVTFQASSTGSGLIAAHCGIGVWDGSAGWSTIAPPVELLFGGGHGFSIATSASIVSDLANLTFNSGDTLIAILDCGATGDPAALTGQPANSLGYAAATASYNVQGGAYNASSEIDGIALIEGQLP